MIVVNKKIKVVIITLLIVLEVASTYLMYRSFNNKNVILDNVKLKGATTKKSGLAIMIEQEDGTYKESTSSTWPEDMMYNDEKSGCIDDKGNAIDGALTYEGGVANIRTKSSSYCFLYFDLIKDDVTIAISTDGESGVMPSSGAYTNNATCSSGSITWSDKYQRIEIGNLSKQSICNLTFIKDTSNKTLLRDEVESKATEITSTNNNGNTDTSYRYTGKQPDNWVWFNNEMWRIIGSIPVTISDGTEINLVKVIQSESIGYIAFDATGTNTTWGSNTLYDLLNNYYYGKKDATGGTLCFVSTTTEYGLCNYTERGISSNPSNYNEKMIKDVYWNVGQVGSTSQAISTVYTTETGTKSTITGKIGLMTASDYGYASGQTSVTLAALSSYEQDNWLYGKLDLCITPYSSSEVFGVVATGSLNNVDSRAIRPVVYLDSSVYIISGTGTESDPYIIGM